MVHYPPRIRKKATQIRHFCSVMPLERRLNNVEKVWATFLKTDKASMGNCMGKGMGNSFFNTFQRFEKDAFRVYKLAVF
ncbi:hypothetical protein EZS27_012332 [termite gut metagenome]|uniref:Uncharacterized protein n=1 Tax=termite gut metagenome TaxID=433724 RepID=A0A5J4S0Y5_9ZZZZ